MYQGLENLWSKMAPALSPLGLLYGEIMRLRRWAYTRGLQPSYRPRAFVISVGNLSLGGEGKTPLVCSLARFLKEKGLRVAILSRGYRGRSRGVVFASRGAGPLEDPELVGDEAYLLALESKVPVVVARDRVQGAFWAIKEFEAEVLLLDDGFQHLRLGRDLDLVVFSATQKTLEERVFPAGRLREPKSALSQADALVVTKTNLAPEAAQALASKLSQFGRPVFEVPFLYGRPYLLTDPRQEAVAPSYFVFCGLADPASFLTAAQKVGPVRGFWALPDHVHYRPGLIKKIKQAQERAGAAALLTSTKDAVKLLPFGRELGPCYVLPAEAYLGKELKNFVWERLKGHTCA